MELLILKISEKELEKHLNNLNLLPIETSETIIKKIRDNKFLVETNDKTYYYINKKKSITFENKDLFNLEKEYDFKFQYKILARKGSVNNIVYFGTIFSKKKDDLTSFILLKDKMIKSYFNLKKIENYFENFSINDFANFEDFIVENYEIFK